MTPSVTTMASSSFDPTAAWQRLVKSVVLALVVTAVVLVAVMVLSARPDWWRGFAAATIASVMAAAASLVPLAIGLKKGFPGVMSGFLASSGLRFLVSIGLAALAVGVGGYPKFPTFILVLPYHAATLSAEVWALTRLQSKS